MQIELRPLRVPEDYEGLAKLVNQHGSEPITAARLEEDDAKLYEKGETSLDAEGRLIGYDRTRYVAVGEEGRIVGYVWSWRAPWTEPGYLNNTLIVSRDYRGQGIGARLFEHLLKWAEGLGAATLVTEIWDDSPESFRFAQRRGFEIERHVFQSVLDLKSANPAEPAGADRLFEELEKEGIRFATLAERLEEEEEAERRIHEICRETMRDIPGFIGDVPDFDEWRKWYLKVEGYAPERVLLAMDGDRYVGVSNIVYNERTNGMYHEYTGISRAYRGRRIATAMKILAVKLAAAHGASYLKTDNDSLNEPILRINRSLGYAPQRGMYRVMTSVREARRAADELRSLSEQRRSVGE